MKKENKRLKSYFSFFAVISMFSLGIVSTSLADKPNLEFKDKTPGEQKFAADDIANPAPSSLRKVLTEQAAPGTYSQGCSAGNNTITFTGSTLLVNPAHMILAGPLEIPADCQASNITINGQSALNPNFQVVVDARRIRSGSCAFEVNSPTTQLTLRNLTFVNLTQGAAAICVNTNAVVRLENNKIGKRSIGLPANHPLLTASNADGNTNEGLSINPSGNLVGILVRSAAKQVTILNNEIQNNQDGIVIEGSAVVQRNTIGSQTINDRNLGTGILLKDSASANVIEDNTIANNGNRGIILTGDSNSTSNQIHRNSIFGNRGLGIDLTSVDDDILGITLNKDGLTTPNNSINLAEGVIITPLGNNQYSFSANSYVQDINNLIVEIYEVDPLDITDPFQKRDGRSYGEGKTLALVAGSIETDNTPVGHFTVNFTGKPNTTYSATLSLPNADSPDNTSEFSAVVKTDPNPDDKNPICEGEGGNQNGDGIKAPNAPSDVVLTKNGSDVVITFKDNSDNEDGFRVERAAGKCEVAVNYTQVTGSPLPANATSVVTITDKNVGSGDRCYRVTAFRNIPSSDDHDLKECPSIVTRQGLSNNPGDGTTDQPPVIVVNPKPTQPKDPVVIIITDHSINEDNFCVERADGTCERPTSDFKPIGKIPSQDKTGTGGTVVYKDPTAEAGHLYCYRAKPEINGNCVDSLVSNKDDAVKLNLDGSTVVPGELVAEGSGGCSISNSVSKFNLFNLIALLAIAPVALARAFRFKKV